MKIIETIQASSEYLDNIRGSKLSIGFVPTMGALHEGHLELFRRARKENDFVVGSIFVNPIQFNNPEDLEKYPRTFDTDKEKLESVGCDLLFYPSAAEMYPEKVDIEYDFGQLDKVMEGEFRPGHFNGVAIVVNKLFDIVGPHRAYFGEKDFQQLAIIHTLVEIENIPVEIIPCPIVREDDGLAMSSRNRRLTVDERKLAPFIYKTLLEVREKAHKNSVEALRVFVNSRFSKYPQLEIEYFDIVDMFSLIPVSDLSDSKNVIACIAVFLGDVRLIDNMILFSTFANPKTDVDQQ